MFLVKYFGWGDNNTYATHSQNIFPIDHEYAKKIMSDNKSNLKYKKAITEMKFLIENHEN